MSFAAAFILGFIILSVLSPMFPPEVNMRIRALKRIIIISAIGVFGIVFGGLYLLITVGNWIEKEHPEYSMSTPHYSTAPAFDKALKR